MSSSGYQPYSTWSWPPRTGADVLDTSTLEDPMPGSFQLDEQNPETEQSPKAELNPEPESTSTFRPEASARSESSRTQRNWFPRTCRICLETVHPRYHEEPGAIPGISRPAASVTYESEDPASGRLIRPCKCKGSSRYVHEACLQTWRHADPAYGTRNYFLCPTCGFRYRLERMSWGNIINSTATQIGLTILIFFSALFLLGFVADPIMNLYFDPYSTLASAARFSKPGPPIPSLWTDDDEVTWAEHFIKGLASLGLLSFVKVLLAMSPWQYFQARNAGLVGGRTGANGRDRMANISWLIVMIGVGTFLWVCG